MCAKKKRKIKINKKSPIDMNRDNLNVNWPF